jgi:hypothetical protein
VEILKDLSVEDIERLRREIKSLHRRIRAELESRERYCAYCGSQLGTAVYGLKYCSAWHRYLDGHRKPAKISRVEFERRRAIRRIRAIKKETDGEASTPEKPNLGEPAKLNAFFRKLRIRRILSEYQTITGESLGNSMRSSRKFKATDQ